MAGRRGSARIVRAAVYPVFQRGAHHDANFICIVTDDMHSRRVSWAGSAYRIRIERITTTTEGRIVISTIRDNRFAIQPIVRGTVALPRKKMPRATQKNRGYTVTTGVLAGGEREGSRSREGSIIFHSRQK